MKQVVLVLTLLAFAGCQSTQSGGRMTVISPPPTDDAAQPEVRWVERGNVFYLELNREE